MDKPKDYRQICPFDSFDDETNLSTQVTLQLRPWKCFRVDLWLLCQTNEKYNETKQTPDLNFR